MKTLVFKSLESLRFISEPEKFLTNRWEAFLKSNGQTQNTFNNLSESLQLDMKIRFNKTRVYHS